MDSAADQGVQGLNPRRCAVDRTIRSQIGFRPVLPASGRQPTRKMLVSHKPRTGSGRSSVRRDSAIAAHTAARIAAWTVQGAGTLALLAYGLHLVGIGHESQGFDTWAYNSLFGVAALLCLARAWFVTADRVAWIFLGLGLASWFAGEVYFTLELADIPLTPVPSVSDYLSLAFYPASYV